MDISLRKAVLTDSEMVLSWRNEASTIPWMGTQRSLTFIEHHTWFTQALSDLNTLFFIIMANHKAIGQIRYLLGDYPIQQAAKVSINITETMHGKGIASIAFRKGSELVRQLKFAHTIFAYVLPANIGSIKAMENAGYIKDRVIEVHGVKHLMMIDQG